MAEILILIGEGWWSEKLFLPLQRGDGEGKDNAP